VSIEQMLAELADEREAGRRGQLLACLVPEHDGLAPSPGQRAPAKHCRRLPRHCPTRGRRRWLRSLARRPARVSDLACVRRRLRRAWRTPERLGSRWEAACRHRREAALLLTGGMGGPTYNGRGPSSAR
jgi:hypothetical protein